MKPISPKAPWRATKVHRPFDSLHFFRTYLKENPNRIYLPNDDYTYFDPLFSQLEQAQSQGKTYRVMHYGDSQIEMDRISSVLRQNLQELFGGSGPNMVPAVQPVPTISVSQRNVAVKPWLFLPNNTDTVEISLTFLNDWE